MSTPGKHRSAALGSLWQLPRVLRLSWRLLRDPRVRRRAKLSFLGAILLAVIYFLSPIDLVPDWLIPVVGHVDDLAVFLWLLSLGANTLRKQSDPAVVAEHLGEVGPRPPADPA